MKKKRKKLKLEDLFAPSQEELIMEIYCDKYNADLTRAFNLGVRSSKAKSYWYKKLWK